jgi:predicted AAA+ superfamily ATPase
MHLTLLAGRNGNLVNRNELANTIGVDNKTIDNYLHVLQNSFHIELIKPFL